MTWPTKKLGEIARIPTGKKDVNEGNPDGKYPFLLAREKELIATLTLLIPRQF